MTVKYSDYSKREKSVSNKKWTIVFSFSFLFAIIGLIILDVTLISIIQFDFSLPTHQNSLFAYCMSLYFMMVIGALVGLIVAEKLNLYTPKNLENTERRLEKIKKSMEKQN